MKTKLVTLAIATSVLMLSGGKEAQSFKVHSPVEEQGDAMPRVGSVEAFADDIRLAVKNSSLSRSEVEDLLKVLNAVDSNGHPMNRIAYDSSSDIIFATRDVDIAISNHYQAGQREQGFVVTIKDSRTGKPAKVKIQDIWAGYPTGYRIHLRQKNFEQAKAPMAVQILADASGSMNGYMDSVKRAIHRLLEELPDHIYCDVVSFGSDIKDYSKRADHGCAPENFDLAGIADGGGTLLFGALEHAFRKLNQAQFNDHQKVVIVLTDGSPGDIANKALLQRLKGEAVTIFFWLGIKDSKAETLLHPFADHYVSDTGDAVAKLQEYFKVFADRVKGQNVLLVVPKNGS